MRRNKLWVGVFWAFLFAAAAVGPGYAQTGLESLFDFSASVESLADAADSGAPMPSGRSVLLTGTIRSFEIEEDGEFAVRVELAAGQWQGKSRVVLRIVTVWFAGEAYRDYFNRRSASYLRPGTMILAVARISGVETREDGTRIVLLEGAHLRRLDT